MAVDAHGGRPPAGSPRPWRLDWTRRALATPYQRVWRNEPKATVGQRRSDCTFQPTSVVGLPQSRAEGDVEFASTCPWPAGWVRGVGYLGDRMGDRPHAFPPWASCKPCAHRCNVLSTWQEASHVHITMLAATLDQEHVAGTPQCASHQKYRRGCTNSAKLSPPSQLNLPRNDVGPDSHKRRHCVALGMPPTLRRSVLFGLGPPIYVLPDSTKLPHAITTFPPLVRANP
ncbi:uncharacterized protein CC84DRAFT_827384 [Paraphaeosphaeria sporulosa]|uniref:Uncharacterized protein n=1 Tax=Paraphaeosphaeria sporulosa TaxID=1460663 RepID=A0A177CEC6_9PLEO|nr:uncharacterized protein CC84DRAFT_827384 [Paraphaeosphaeria sporulosa]OAG05090.1 hypothetical protein CC84DRAFT_827384 [Paraphaeosphaeria sporulosa]